MNRALALVAVVAVTVVAVVVGWRTYGQEQAEQRGGGSSTGSGATEEASPTATPTPARLPPSPRAGTCHRLTYAAAIAPTASPPAVPCRQPHTSVTFAVGTLDTVVDGHLVTVDSDRVRAQVARECPRRFADFVGGTLEQRRLSVLRPVQFTPTVAQSDRGATWFRCDVVAVAGDSRLAPLGPGLRGAVATEPGRDRYGLCATAGPGEEGFGPVACGEDHTWRAVRTLPFEQGAYPGVDTVRTAGTTPCRAAGRAASGDSLDFEWGYEWPTAAQWRDGRTWGTCWVPD